MSEDGDELPELALAQCWIDRHGAEEKRVEVRKEWRVWKGEYDERRKGASAVENVDGVLRAEREAAFVAVVGVSV